MLPEPHYLSMASSFDFTSYSLHFPRYLIGYTVLDAT